MPTSGELNTQTPIAPNLPNSILLEELARGREAARSSTRPPRFWRSRSSGTRVLMRLELLERILDQARALNIDRSECWSTNCEIAYKRDPTRNAVHIIESYKGIQDFGGVTFRA